MVDLTVRNWPGPGLSCGRRKLALAGSAVAPKVRFLAWPRTHAAGHNRSFPTRSKILAQRTREWQVSGDEPERFVGSTRQ
jgi:hypothetical protein